MYYYNSFRFYLHLKHFLSDEFKCVRIAYLFDFLPENEGDVVNKYVDSIFPKKFIILISILKKKYRLEKMDFYLKKFLKNLQMQFENPRCYVETHAVYSEAEIQKIEEGIRKKFNNDRLVFRYKIDKSLLFGFSFRLNYKMYDVSLNNMLNIIQRKTLSALQNKEEI